MQEDIGGDAAVADAPSPGSEVSTRPSADQDHGITEELVIEEISIDGMCGVY